MVVREMPLRELVDLMLGVVGKDGERIRELFSRGAFVSGASRFRWEPFAPDPGALVQLLATFPDAEPHRAFAAEGCVRAVFRAASLRVEVLREAASRRSLFRRRTFWDALMEFAAASNVSYAGYSYRERADCYRITLDAPTLVRILEQASALRYSHLAGQLRGLPADAIELQVPRSTG